MPRGIAKGKTKLTDEERKAKKREYFQRPENVAKKREYFQRPENIARAKAYYQTPEVKAREKKIRDRPENIAKVKKIREGKRFNILSEYSKRLSNSDIPCCRCCGLNSHLDFLEIDHITGKKQMDSIPELVAIGYSSKLGSINLINWIIKNDFPDGFQILCRNCNFTKGMKKNNNKCPHERK
jgi:rubrerythrin